MLTAALRLPAMRAPLRREHWTASLMLALMLILYLIAGLSVAGIGNSDGLANAKVTNLLPDAVRLQAPPQPEPLQFRKIEPSDAVAINAAVPLFDGPNPAARPFALLAKSGVDGLRSIECLTAAVYYEAASEPLDGQRAVAQVVLNRVRHPAYPGTVCGVVFEGSQRATGCQFTFTCDGSLARTPHAGLWRQARQVAEAALAGKVFDPVGWATHYHTNWVVPYWSSSLVKTALVGTHIFYRWEGGWGKPGAFTKRYAGVEPDVSKMGRLTSAPAATLAEGGDATDALAKDAADPTGASASSIDSFQRAVLRRYEPATRQGVATVLAAQTRQGDAVATAHRWALTGDNTGAKDVPLGKKVADAAPAKPACLDGVKKTGDPAGSTAKPLTC